MTHLEFVVLGHPRSHQTSDRSKLKEWAATIRAEAAKVWTGPPLTGKLRFILIHFHEGDTPPMDDDNMVKPIRDALTGLVYADDRQIRFSETTQVSIDDSFRVRGGALIVTAALSRGDPFLFVRIEDAPTVLQLPR